jgi:hypothetical protein
MADPRLQLRRGTQSPAIAVTTALVGEPFFDTTNDNLWIADGAASFINIGGASFTTRVDNFLTAHTGTVSGIVKIGDADNSAQVSLTVPATLTASYTLTLPSTDGNASEFLQTDGSGVLSWVALPSSSFTIAGDTGTPDSFSTGGTLTFVGSDPIDTAITDNTVTISAKDATTTTKGVASFNATDFTVTSGAVTINAESIQDTVGAMVTGNTETGIAVTYDDTNGKLDFAVTAQSGFTIFGVTGTAATTGSANVVSDQAADTLLFAAGEGIDLFSNETTDTITITAEVATDTNLGVASFSTDNFLVTAGVVTIKDNGVALGTETTGNYVATVSTTAGGGITGGAAGSEGTAITLALDVVGLTAESAIADGDSFPFYDLSATANRKATADNLRDYVLGGVSGDITINASGVAAIAANSVALGTDTTGQYASTITGGAGLTATAAGADDGTAYTITVGAGEGITVNADDVALKNGTNLANATVMGWDNTNNQLTNAPITYSGNDVAVTGDLTVTGNDIKSSGGTTAITLSGANVTIQGDLTVSGATTTLNTTTLSVEDRVIELGLVNGTAPVAATTWDTAVAFNYFATTAKKSAIVWIDNAGFELAATLTETAGTGGSDPQIAVDTRASLGIASLFIGSIGTSTNEVITASKTVVNVTIDCGSY